VRLFRANDFSGMTSLYGESGMVEGRLIAEWRNQGRRGIMKKYWREMIFVVI